MAKYYVESGPGMQIIVQASNFIEAILKAFVFSDGEEPLALADVVIVNQRGFVRERGDHRLVGDEIILPTRLLLGEPEQADQAASSR